MPSKEDELILSDPKLKEAKVRSILAEAAKAEAEAATELIQQDIKRAELAKLKLESKKLSGDLAKLALETQHGELLVEEQALSMESLRRAATEERAKDYWNHRYVLNDTITGQTASSLINALTRWSRTAPGCDIEVVINSPGGSIIPGFAVIDYLDTLKASDPAHKIRTHSIGMAASMGGVLLQAGTVRSMGSNAMLLLHQGSLMAGGSYGEAKDQMKFMEMLHERILKLFVERAGGKVTKAFLKKNWERQDWWLTAEDALKLGLVDEIR